jgi:hypothetical protein
VRPSFMSVPAYVYLSLDQPRRWQPRPSANCLLQMRLPRMLPLIAVFVITLINILNQNTLFDLIYSISHSCSQLTDFRSDNARTR